MGTTQISVKSTAFIPTLASISRGGFRGAKGAVLPLQIFFTNVTATINSMKISFNGVLLLLNLKNCVYNYIVYRCWQYYPTAYPSMFLKPTIKTKILSLCVAITSVKEV